MKNIYEYNIKEQSIYELNPDGFYLIVKSTNGMNYYLTNELGSILNFSSIHLAKLYRDAMEYPNSIYIIDKDKEIVG